MTTLFYSHSKKVISVILVSLLFCSCKHKTDFNSLREVSYSEEIAPLISSNCSASGCHGFANYEEFSLSTYDQLIKGGISAGSPNTSELYNTLISLGDDVMPKKPFKALTEKEIQLIYVWIGQGAKNN
jgi:hypothetical protein